jgi:uncharacterized protein (TIGR02246 family)
MKRPELSDFAARYAAAWSGQDPDTLASFYEPDGSLAVNAGEPARGRPAIAAKAAEFMTAFPDMIVKMDTVVRDNGDAIFHWTWTGTNTGPGGTGRAVCLSGYEVWSFGSGGLIAQSQGHYDEAEYERQVNGGPD